jgi:hypothetical protein
LGEEIIGAKLTNAKAVLGSIISENVGFKDNNFFYIIQRYIQMIRPMVCFQAIKIDKKLKR